MTKRWLFLAASLALAACSKTEDVRGVVVQVISDLRVPQDLDAVDLVVQRDDGREVVRQSFDLGTTSGRVSLPITFGLYPQDEKSSEPFRVVATGRAGAVVRVERSATLTFPTAGGTVVLSLPLLAICRGVTCSRQHETCAEAGVCRSDVVVVASLPPYKKGELALPSLDAGTPASDAATDAAPERRDAAVTDAASVDVPPSCAPKAEDCWNGVDDDCDELPDCADPDCTPAAQCVPAEANGVVGVAVGEAEACPAGFDARAPVTVHAELSAPACGGCTCGPAAATCPAASIFTYQTAAECAADVNNTGGHATSPATVSEAAGCTTPNYDTVGGNLYGLRVAPMTPTLASCAPSGSATFGAATWAKGARLCAANRVGAGCPVGQACVAKPAAAGAKLCGVADGTRACPAGASKLGNSDWYAGLSDTRSCGACTCGAPVGGSCSTLNLHVGNDYTCAPNNGDVHPGEKTACTQMYSPGLQLTGTPRSGSCAASAPTLGAATPTQPKTICCAAGG
jgi:hypothetical protein